LRNFDIRTQTTRNIAKNKFINFAADSLHDYNKAMIVSLRFYFALSRVKKNKKL